MTGRLRPLRLAGAALLLLAAACADNACPPGEMPAWADGPAGRTVVVCVRR